VWLGPIGRAFIWLSSRGVAGRPTGTTVPRVTTPRAAQAAASPAVHSRGNANGALTPPAGRPGASQDRVGVLEARVAALERWRDESKS